MAAAPTTVVTWEELKFFYKSDRELYCLLTMNLWRDPLESMNVMALWHWLERSGLNNVIGTISMVPYPLINQIADEAISCVNHITNSNPLAPSPQQVKLPLTQSILGADLSTKFSFENRGDAIRGIRKAFDEVCLKALPDLVQLAKERNALALAQTQIAMSSFIDSSFSGLNLSNSNPRVHNPPEAVHPDERTLFVTFSKGYPVPVVDIHEFFNRNYGDCIESIVMQDVAYGEQSLYACITFCTPDVIEAVLNGVEKAKFTIKGKHMWVRKFVSNHKRHLSPQRLLHSRPSASGVGSVQDP